MKTRPEIESLTARVAARHDRFLARRTVIFTSLATATVLILLALIWVLRGHSVPLLIPLTALVLAALAATIYIHRKRMSPTAAASAADTHFHLKDGLTTARHLAQTEPEAPATDFQWNWLKPRLSDCDPATITRPFPKKKTFLATILTLAAITLCLLPPSATVRAAEKSAAETRERVTQSKAELQELLEELDKEITTKEVRENLDLDEFRKLVDEIDETGDRTEAARQFARIEQKIRNASRSLDQARDDETLKLAAKELSKAEDTDARKLGKKLDQKELKEAAEQLEKLAAKKADAKDFKKSPEAKKQALDEAKKNLAKMRAASKRLAAAGKQRQAARQAEGAESKANSKAQANGKPTEGEGQALEDMLTELDEAAAEMEKNLEEMEFDPDAEFDPNAPQKMASAKSKLGQHLKKMHGKSLAKSKLDALRQALAQSQSYAQGQTQQLGLGGQKPGTGSHFAERKERDDSQKNGALAELKGQHGEGPSLSAVEDAESGSGTSTRTATSKERDLARQMESFVQRDDIPEALKLGVRNYFKNLEAIQKEK